MILPGTYLQVYLQITFELEKVCLFYIIHYFKIMQKKRKLRMLKSQMKKSLQSNGLCKAKPLAQYPVGYKKQTSSNYRKNQ